MVLKFRWLVLWLIPALPAAATTLLALDLEGLSRSSDAVVRATVQRVAAHWTGDRARIVTEVELEVLDAWKGSPPRRVVVTQPGGEVGDVGQVVHGVPTFVVGEELVVFLEARGSRFAVAGMAQGRFKVERADAARPASARQDQCGDLFLLDATSRQPVSRGPIALDLDELRRRVVAFGPSPAGPGGAEVPR